MNSPGIGSVFVLAGLSLAALASGASAESAGPCPLVPRPKEYRESGPVLTLAPETVIVVGAQASEPERYAAEMLQAQLERRFGVRLPIQSEDDVTAAVPQVLLLGQPATHAWLARLCSAHAIELSPSAPGPDGFIIECVTEQARQAVLIGGSNPRGVVYGQNAFFDLLRRDGERIVFSEVRVRDWPSIAWRGRPHSVLAQHLVPGALDAYLRSRINFTDVRDNPDVKATAVFPARKASMGFPPGRPVDSEPVAAVIREAHRRGLFVYGTVSCAVPAERVGDVVQTFSDLIGLGVDGLWLSFDDSGAGAAAPQVIREVLALGARHGMNGRRIAITPPLEEYQHIDREFNRQAATEWGLAEAQWLFTRVPCAADLAAARQVGIKGLPGWWHNLVDIEGGFLHNGGVVCSLRADGKPGYLDLQPLAKGWHAPAYEALREAPQHCDCVLLWGVVGGWPEEYEVGALGLWAWDPASHDWSATRDAVYRLVYGPAGAATAREFDDRLAELKGLFELPLWDYLPNRGWPCRLRRLEDRAKALALIDELERTLTALRSQAPAGTAIAPARLENVYLEPMQATVAYARRMVQLDYPEYDSLEFEPAMTALVETGDTAAAETLLQTTRARVLPQLARVRRELAGLKGIDAYTAFWEEQCGSVEQWRQRAAARRAAMAARFAKLVQAGVASFFPYKENATAADLDALLTPLAVPPAGAPLVELQAADWSRLPSRWSGAFCNGLYEWHGQTLVAVAYPRHIASAPGQAAEVCARAVVPATSGRLVLDAFVNDTRVDNRYPGYRYLQLWADDRLLWEEDIALPRSGREWVTLDVTGKLVAGTTAVLRFRVVDKRAVGDHLSVAFLGPVRLRQP